MTACKTSNLGRVWSVLRLEFAAMQQLGSFRKSFVYTYTCDGNCFPKVITPCLLNGRFFISAGQQPYLCDAFRIPLHSDL